VPEFRLMTNIRAPRTMTFSLRDCAPAQIGGQLTDDLTPGAAPLYPLGAPLRAARAHFTLIR
jgi:hypothetical protein